MLCAYRRIKSLGVSIGNFERFEEFLGTDYIDRKLKVNQKSRYEYMPHLLLSWFRDDKSVFFIASTNVNSNLIVYYDGRYKVLKDNGFSLSRGKLDLESFDFEQFEIVGIDDNNCYNRMHGNLTNIPFHNYIYRTNDNVIYDSSGKILHNYEVSKIYTPFEAKAQIARGC